MRQQTLASEGVGHFRSHPWNNQQASIIILTFSCLFPALLRCCYDHIAHYTHLPKDAVKAILRHA